MGTTSVNIENRIGSHDTQVVYTSNIELNNRML